MRKLKLFFVDIFIYIIEKLMKKEFENPPIHIIIMDNDTYTDYIEFRDNVFLVYESEKELKEDFPNAVPTTRTKH